MQFSLWLAALNDHSNHSKHQTGSTSILVNTGLVVPWELSTWGVVVLIHTKTLNLTYLQKSKHVWSRNIHRNLSKESLSSFPKRGVRIDCKCQILRSEDWSSQIGSTEIRWSVPSTKIEFNFSTFNPFSPIQFNPFNSGINLRPSSRNKHLH